MESIVEKRQALDRAIEMISRGNIDELRYVALELRRCIEAVVYEKLWVYRDRFSAEVARKWQPPQAFRALLVMEPNAEHTKTVRVAKQIEPGVPSSGPFHALGVDQRFPSPWLNKTYNKLGSYCHASWPFAKNPEKNSIETGREFLKQVATDMESFVRQSFTSTCAAVVDFQCSVCGTAIKANVTGVEQAGEVTCLNPDCGCRYFATEEGKEFIFQLDALTAACSGCSLEIHIPTQKLALGYQFSCGGCNRRYEVVEQQWQFRELKNEG
jgi:hypothetical protein